MKERIPVAVLGATGAVGQRIVAMVAGHPWFRLDAVGASERSAGKAYQDAARWLLPEPMPEEARALTVRPCDPGALRQPLVFSALDADAAGPIEEAFEAAGRLVVTNARNHRMRADVPLVVPEVNGAHLDLVAGRPGAIVANPNCSTIGLVMALAPLWERFGLEAVSVVTMQALSGAGYPGVPSMDMIDNVVPFISGEEQKLEAEPRKIFGRVTRGTVVPAELALSASCNRVPVSDGHLLRVSVKLGARAQRRDLEEAWTRWRGWEGARKLPSSPELALAYRSEPDRPQPRLDRDAGGGMTVSVGRLEPDSVLDYRFAALVHNTIRGAAGGTLLLAELALSRGLGSLAAV